MTSKKPLLVLGVCASLGLLALWCVFESERATSSASAVVMSSAYVAVEEFASPPLVESATRVEAVPEHASPDASASVPEYVESRVLLRGTVVCAFGEVELTSIEVSLGGNPPLIGRVEGDGTFEMDVTKLVRTTRQFSHDKNAWYRGNLDVIARHPRTLSERADVSTEPVVGVKSGQTIVLSVEFRLVRRECRVRGRVLTEDGAPLVATLSVFNDDGGKLGEIVRGAPVSSQGEFQLSLPTGEHVFVAYDRNWRPTTMRVSCGASELELAPLVLMRGLAIHGVASLGGAPVGEGATVQVAWSRPMTLLAAESSQLGWTGDSFEWARRTAPTDASGAFEIGGLAPELYDVALIGVRNAALQNTEPLKITAPASDVVLAPNLCRLRLEVIVGAERKRVAFSTHEILRFGRSFATRHTDADGRATLWLAPGSSVEASFDVSEILGVTDAPERTFQLPLCAGSGELELRIDL